MIGERDRPLLHSSFIKHVEQLPDRLRVLEYGSGASTVWLWCDGHNVTAIEHDQRWSEYVLGRCLACVLTVQLPYARWGVGMGLFDMCIVDGRGRPECLAAARTVAEFVVLDDAQRPRYAKALIEMDHWGDRVEFAFDAALDPQEREGVQLLGWTVRA